MIKRIRTRACLAALASVVGWAGGARLFAADSTATHIQQSNPPLMYDSEVAIVPYVPAARSLHRWTVCVLLPTLTDAYWLAVNYGMVEAAQRLGVALRVYDAGGYAQLERQQAQLDACGRDVGVHAVVLATVSFDALRDEVLRVGRRIPVLAAVNDIETTGIAARVGASWYDMGRAAGEYLRRREAADGEPIEVAWFPGAQDAGWAPFIDRGFRDAIAGSRFVVSATVWGEASKSVQRSLVETTLAEHPSVRYLVGNAMMAEAAVGVLRVRGRGDDVGIVATYFTPGIYRGILRGRILAAPTDSPVLQGRLAIGQAVDLLEARSFARQVAPVVTLVDPLTLPAIDLDESLPARGFTAVLRYSP